MSEHERVLVVDDDFSIRQLICTLVKREGVPVDGAADGEVAVEMLKRHRYAVILLDLMMPKVDGFEVVRFIKEQHAEPKPIVFVISAYGDQAFKRVDTSVVAGIIHKPFDVGEIGTLVRQCALGMRPADNVDAGRARSLRDFDGFVQWTAGPPDRSTDS